VVSLSVSPLRRPGARLGIGPQLIVVLLVVGLAGAMAIQPTRQLLAQRARMDQMTTELRRIERTNRRLEAYVTRLIDPDYVEQQARAQLGLVRPGETAYIVMPPRKRATRGNAQPADRRHDTRRSGPGFLERLATFIGLP
jgi:cell division protein FtsB